jgi:hypothetical protein
MKTSWMVAIAASALMSGCGEGHEDTYYADQVLKDQNNFEIAQQRGDVVAQCKYAHALEIDAGLNTKDPLSTAIVENMQSFQKSSCYR